MKQKSGPDKAPAEQVLKNIRRQTRRKYSADAGYGYLEVRCLGCDTHQTVALDIRLSPSRSTSRYMRCKDCSQLRGCPYKCSNLDDEISASDPP